MEELWKDIPGYERLYQASTHGRIRTCDGKVTSSSRFSRRVWKQRILKQKITKNSKGRFDARVELWSGAEHKTLLVARLIAITWCNGFKDGMTVNHIDGNSMNNNADNLEWISLADNIRHGFETGLYKMQKKCVLVDEYGKRQIYRSQVQASRSIGRSNGYIANKLYRNKPIVSSDGKIYQIEIS